MMMQVYYIIGVIMFKCSHFTLIVISGLVWFAVGVFLMSLGVHFITDSIINWENLIASPNFSFFKLLSSFIRDGDQAASFVIAISLMVGYLKGRYVLIKSVRRGVSRILSLPNPCSIKNIYSTKYYLLLGLMVCLGLGLKIFHVIPDIRGSVDLMIGAALLKGAMLYFRDAFAVRKGTLAGEA